MHSCDSNVDFEWVSFCHRNLVLIKINNLNTGTTIFTVDWNKFPCIITVAFLNTWRNELMRDFSIREGFYWCGIRKKADILFLLYCTNKTSLQNCLWGNFRYSSMLLGVRGISERQTSIRETTDMNSSNIYQISSRYVRW